jgi:hypothetical protein
MTELLRICDPAECDERGVPLDWERCRACGGKGLNMSQHAASDCAKCGGHGSLKAAALAALKAHVWKRGGQHPEDPVTRCEGCGHPMSDGTWVNPPAAGLDRGPLLDDEGIRGLLTQPYSEHGFHGWAERRGAVHWSRCDEQCDHGSMGRIRDTQRGENGGQWLERAFNPEPRAHGGVVAGVRQGYEVEASWRSVDVRVGMVARRAGLTTMNPLIVRPFDLRPKNVAVLCLRCWADDAPRCLGCGKTQAECSPTCGARMAGGWER